MGILNFFKAKPHNIKINSLGSLKGTSNRTILQSADEAGLDLPNSCRVGGCGACKCKLKEGSIKALTEAAYVLTEQELEEGYILTCQSQPKSDLVLEYAEQINVHELSITANLTQIEPLTANIFKVCLELEQPLNFKAGQYVEVTVANFPNARCYSLVNVPNQSGQSIHLFVQQVEGGSLSNWLTHNSNIGKNVQISKAKGNCTFEQAKHSGALVFASTGSGLAPIISLLNHALQEKSKRSTYVILGANTEKDLFYLDQLRSIQSRWIGDFKIYTVLSQQPNTTHSLNGYIQDHLPSFIADEDMQQLDIYLCGNPHMVDSVSTACRSLGIQSNQLHLDKFVQQESNSIKQRMA